MGDLEGVPGYAWLLYATTSISAVQASLIVPLAVSKDAWQESTQSALTSSVSKMAPLAPMLVAVACLDRVSLNTKQPGSA